MNNYPIYTNFESKSKKGRRLVIPDVHGCNQTLRALLQKINLTPTDTLFFLGDYVDKGIDSQGVLDTLLDLQQQNFHLVLLRGNHDQTLLESVLDYPENPLIFHQHYRMGGLLDENGRFCERYKALLGSLYYYAELEDYFLVHAGFNTKITNPLTDFEEMLWLRKPVYDKKLFNAKKIIYGHQPTSLKEIKTQLKENQSLLCLDNGAVFFDYEDYGNLVCFDLDSKELLLQKNIEQERIEARLI